MVFMKDILMNFYFENIVRHINELLLQKYCIYLLNRNKKCCNFAINLDIPMMLIFSLLLTFLLPIFSSLFPDVKSLLIF